MPKYEVQYIDKEVVRHEISARKNMNLGQLFFKQSVFSFFLFAQPGETVVFFCLLDFMSAAVLLLLFLLLLMLFLLLSSSSSSSTASVGWQCSPPGPQPQV